MWFDFSSMKKKADYFKNQYCGKQYGRGRKEKHKEKFEWTLPLPGCFKMFRRGDEIPWEALHLLAFIYLLYHFLPEYSHPPISFTKQEQALISFPQKTIKSYLACYIVITCQVSFLRNKLEYLLFQCRLRKLAMLI